MAIRNKKRHSLILVYVEFNRMRVNVGDIDIEVNNAVRAVQLCHAVEMYVKQVTTCAKITGARRPFAAGTFR